MRRDPYTQRLHVDAFGGDGDSDHALERDYSELPDSREVAMFKFDFHMEQQNTGLTGVRWQVIPHDGGKWREASPEEVSMWLRLTEYREKIDRLIALAQDASQSAVRERP